MKAEVTKNRAAADYKRWLAFLRNHREAIAAMDFFTVPTITFGVLYCFFVISHDRRRILHFNVTNHPTSQWIVQQLREAFPFESAPRFLIFDRDAKYGWEVPAAVRSLKISPVRTSFESPWQNGVAERWVESCRRDLLNHIIAVNERHLKRLLSEYVRYYHEDRTHLGLGKGTPNGRIRSLASGWVLSQERWGGLQHRYVHRGFVTRWAKQADFHRRDPRTAESASLTGATRLLRYFGSEPNQE